MVLAVSIINWFSFCKELFFSKIHRAGGMAQVVDYLPNKLKAFNSYSSTYKKKKGEQFLVHRFERRWRMSDPS
jgi:hypothetical protein